MTGSDGEREAVTLREGMTSAPDPARRRIPPKKEGAAWAGGLGAGRRPRPHHCPCRGRTLAPGDLVAPAGAQAREGRELSPTCHSPCNASLALASSCSFWASWTLSSVAARTSEDLPPCDSSRSFISISFICRRRWTSSWSRDTSSRSSARGEGHTVRAGDGDSRSLTFLGTA